ARSFGAGGGCAARPLGGHHAADLTMHFQLQAAITNVLLLWILTAPHELAHVDWLGTAILPFVTSLLGGGFLGWGKPVRTDPSKLKGGLNGLALVALAGPFSNVVFAVVLGVVAVAAAH